MNKFDKRNTRKYFAELGGALVLYAILMLGTGKWFEIGVPEAWKPVVVLIPMIGFGAMIVAVIRMLNRVDELQQRYVKDDVFVAFFGTAFLTFGYGFLEEVGFPKLSMFSVWVVMGGLWFLVWLIQLARMRRSNA